MIARLAIRRIRRLRLGLCRPTWRFSSRHRIQSIREKALSFESIPGSEFPGATRLPPGSGQNYTAADTWGNSQRAYQFCVVCECESLPLDTLSGAKTMPEWLSYSAVCPQFRILVAARAERR